MANKKYETLIEKVNLKIQKHIAEFNAGLEDNEKIVYEKIEVGDYFKQDYVDADFDDGRGRWIGSTGTKIFQLVEKNNKYYFAYLDENLNLESEDKWWDLLDEEDSFTVKSLFDFLLDEEEPCWNYKNKYDKNKQ